MKPKIVTTTETHKNRINFLNICYIEPSDKSFQPLNLKIVYSLKRKKGIVRFSKSLVIKTFSRKFLNESNNGFLGVFCVTKV